MEVIGTPDFNYLDGWVNTFGNIVYVWTLLTVQLQMQAQAHKEIQNDSLKKDIR